MAVKYSIRVDEQEIVTISEFIEDKRNFVPANMPVSPRLISADNVIVSMPFAIASVDPFTPRKVFESSVHVL